MDVIHTAQLVSNIFSRCYSWNVIEWHGYDTERTKTGASRMIKEGETNMKDNKCDNFFYYIFVSKTFAFLCRIFFRLLHKLLLRAIRF